ncbi:MAG: zf-HC2 domain-containing protein [Eubacterium sp.]|nr:zf-HC2 domain-containing protein [Eubacterium sp.]
MSKSDKLNCNIIKDLLPSYLECLCTQDTKVAVEEHLSECSACNKLAAAMRETDFVTERIESAEIDYMKKAKRHFIKKGSYASIALAVFILLGVVTSMSSYTQLPMGLYYVSLPFLLAVTKVLLPSPHLQLQTKQAQKIAAIAGILLTCYSVFILLFIIQKSPGWVSQEYAPFGIKLADIGPFLHLQLYAAILYQAVMYVYGIYRTMHGKPASFLHMSLYLTYGFIILSGDLFLGRLSGSTREAYYALLQPICVFLLEWIAVMGMLWILKKKSCR